jgi:Rrf2 family protein
MLSLSQTTGYAIEALAHLNPPGGKPLLLREVARRAKVPGAYLAKRMPDLVAAGLVTSRRGQRGGLVLARQPEEITLLQISEAVEARRWLDGCLLGLTSCSDERACPVHAFWKPVRGKIEKILRTTTLASVIAHEVNLAQRTEAVHE